MPFPWRWNGGTISANLGVIWEMSDNMTDIASLVNATHTAEEGLARAADNYSARIEQILGVIEAIELNLRQRRERIEELQARHEGLALHYRQLGKSVDSATADLTQRFAAVLSNLGSNVAIAKLLAGDAPAPATDSNLAPEKSALSRIAECVGEAQGTPNEVQVNFGGQWPLTRRETAVR